MQNVKTGRLILLLAASILAIGIALQLTRHGQPKPGGLSSDSGREDPPTRPASEARFRPAAVPAAEAPVEPDDQTAAILAMKLPREAIVEYLLRHHRDAASLLAAFHASGDANSLTGDINYLKEAATNFPNDPHVQWMVLAHNAFPEERRNWLETFKAASPSNSLANYLSARDYFKDNQPDAAVKELLTAAGKSQFENYAMESFLGEKELYASSGKTPLESDRAALAGAAGDMLPDLAKMKAIAQGIGGLQKQYLDAGDTGSVENLAQMGTGLANRLTSGNEGKLMISQLVGIALEAITLQSLDQNTPYDFLGGKTPGQRLAELKQQRASLKELTQSFNAAYPNLSEAEMLSYSERARIYGEVQAKRWVQQQHGMTTPNSGN